MSGERKEPHVIDPEKCVSCYKCLCACPKDAIVKTHTFDGPGCYEYTITLVADDDPRLVSRRDGETVRVGSLEFEVLATPAEAPYALMLPDVAMNAAVLWNGVAIGDGGRFDDPRRRLGLSFGRPLRFGLGRCLGLGLGCRVAGEGR